MQQTEFEKLLAVPFAEFERRVHEARLRAANLEALERLRAASARKTSLAARALRIEELVA